ncbi:MAG: hypothetical protein HOQ00_00645, partial [Agromyces sp.]|nr:hypothetical protein [Agromyces sp.]
MTAGETRTAIRVGGDAGYDVVVGRGVVAELGDALGPSVRKVLVVHAPTLGARAAELREELGDRFEVL